jgi:hypothetical protein
MSIALDIAKAHDYNVLAVAHEYAEAMEVFREILYPSKPPENAKCGTFNTARNKAIADGRKLLAKYQKQVP